MKLVFFWNYLNHHQVCIADALYDLLGENFVFVATLPKDERELKGGLDYSLRPYCILAAESPDKHLKALEYARIADVCVFGACSQEYAVERAKQKICGLAFECGERWLKRGWLNVWSPVLRGWWFNYIRYYRKRSFYKLCSSAFTSQDDIKLGCYCGKHYKWGYFTSVEDPFKGSSKRENNGIIRLLWCSRFIEWKHPELAIECTKRLIDSGYRILLDMYGDGPLRVEQENRVKNNGLSEIVFFHGNVPNSEIQQAMAYSDIFLFTSDRQEGWGAVANEAMAAGCCLVGSNEIGAVPYLIKTGYNGLIFESKSSSDLFEKVKILIDNPEKRSEMAMHGMETMNNLWSASNAAKSLLTLIDDLQNNRNTSIMEGPCSIAL